MDIIARIQTYYQASAANQENNSIPKITALPPERPQPTESGKLGYTPIMVCTRDTLMPTSTMSGLEFVVLSSQSSITAVRETLDTNARGFDPDAPPATDDDAIAFRAALLTNRAITAMLNSQPVAAGMFTPPSSGIAELVGITTLIPYRRRGIGAALTEALAKTAFTQGIDTIFLHTDNPAAYRIYDRLGFRTVAVITTERD